MNKFPGNLYADSDKIVDHKVSPDIAFLARTILILAFEQRTANLIAAATPVDQTGLTPDQLARSESALAEARERLGRS